MSWAECFLPGRQITDNALIAFECIHATRHGEGDRQEFGAHKLDLSKAYEIRLGFLKSLLKKLGFHPKWVQWVMLCVTTVRFQLCVPLPPHMVYAKVIPCHHTYSYCSLTDSQFWWSNGLGNIHGLRVCGHAPSVTHLLMADDSLLLFRTNEEHATVVKSVIADFEWSTGQFAKPSQVFTTC